MQTRASFLPARTGRSFLAISFALLCALGMGGCGMKATIGSSLVPPVGPYATFESAAQYPPPTPPVK